MCSVKASWTLFPLELRDDLMQLVGAPDSRSEGVAPEWR